jgi:uncharacterized protein
LSNQAENIDLVKQLYDAFAKKDLGKILGLLHPDVIWGEPANPYNPCSGTRYGHVGFMEWASLGRQAEEIIELTTKKFLSDSDSVAVFGYLKCKALTTDKIYESDFIHLVTFENNKIIKFQEFFDTYTAGEAFRQ